jgi:hypothetical protein
MKKSILLVLALCLLSTAGQAQTWHTANQVTVGWDAVAPIQPTDTIKYQLYVRQDLVSAGIKAGDPVATLQAVVTMPSEGDWWIGVETLRYVQGVADPFRSSTKAWSHDPAACGPAGPFGVRYFVLPAPPGGLFRKAVGG